MKSMCTNQKSESSQITNMAGAFRGRSRGRSGQKVARMPRQPRSKGKSGDPGGVLYTVVFYFQHTAQSIEHCLTARSSTAGGLGIFMAVAGAMVAACVGAMFRDHQKQAADTSMLHKMLRKPINYTEHAKCRMDCRCAAICCQANASLLYL